MSVWNAGTNVSASWEWWSRTSFPTYQHRESSTSSDPVPSPASIRAIRRILLVFFLAFIGLLGFLFWFGRQQPTTPTVAVDRRTTTPGEVDVDISIGFDHTVSIGDTKLFRIRAAQVVNRGDRQVLLKDVGPIEIYRPDGNTIFAQAEEASFDLQSNTAQLRGNVQMRGAAGTELRANRLDLDPGRIVRSRGRVQLWRGKGLFGRADRLEAELENDIVRLVGRVRFTMTDSAGGPNYLLQGRRATYLGQDERLDVAGGVLLRQGRSEIKAHELSAFASDGALSRIELRRRVRGTWVQAAQRPAEASEGGEALSSTADDQVLHVIANNFDLDFDTQGELTRTRLARNPPAKLTLVRGPTRHTLQGLVVDIAWSAGNPLSGTAAPQALIVEHTPDGGRSATGESARFRFARGELSQVDLTRDVRVQEEDATTAGDTATYDSATRTFVVNGQPAQTTFTGGHLTSPRISYDAELRTARTVRPVRGEYEQGQEPGVLGEGDGPTKFEAQEAVWEQDGGIVHLIGDARLWRNRDLLVAETIDSELDRRVVFADGDVRMIFERPDAETGEMIAVEATSDSLEYSEDEEVVHLLGNASAQRQGRTLSCANMDVELDDGGSAERMRCDGATRMVDTVGKQVVTGDTAVYEIGAEEAIFTGDPVLARSDDGSEVTGKRLTYDVSTGEAVMDRGPQPEMIQEVPTAAVEATAATTADRDQGEG